MYTGGPKNHSRLGHRRCRDRRRLRHVWQRGRRLKGPRETKIQHFDRAVGTKLDVRGFQIAMNDPLIVCRFKGFRNLPRDQQRFVDRNGAAMKPLARVFAFDSSITSA